MSFLWIISIVIKNVSIVDLFWGFGFVLANGFYFISTDGFLPRKIILLIMVSIWGLRLSVYLAWRNIGKGEDFRYQQFRKKYGENRYWWISFFQTFLLQGILMWLISAPLLGAQYYGLNNSLGIFDFAGMILWITGFIFEAGGDFQLAMFKADPSNKGKVSIQVSGDIHAIQIISAILLYGGDMALSALQQEAYSRSWLYSYDCIDY